jgi:hypothetical protein
MAKIYCGNSANYNGLITGTHVPGTNYQCMRRGIGIGLHLPYDESYTQPYAPIDGRKFYCGNAPAPPIGGGYFAIGSASKCQQIGVGVGKAQRASLGPPTAMFFIRFVLPYLLFFLIIGIIFIVFYYKKPNFLTKEDSKNSKNIVDWGKFLPYYTISCLITGIIIWWFWKKYVRRWI